MTLALEVEAVTLRHLGASGPAVVDASFELAEGAALGIVGESGSGKTTLARALFGLVPVTSGTIRVFGDPVTLGGQRRRREQIQMVFQDPYGSLNPRLSPLSTVAEVFSAVRGFSGNQAKREAAALLEEVGLAGDALTRKPRGLSGGQRQRVGIARALACNPAILVADEPTSALDVSVQGQILRLIADLRARRGLTLVIVSHDLGVVRASSEQTLVMRGGRIVDRGPTRELFDSPSNEYTRVLVESLPDNLVRASTPRAWTAADA